MPTSAKVSTILIGLSMLLVFSYPVFAQDQTTRSATDTAAYKATSSAAYKKQLILNKGPLQENTEKQIETMKEKLASRAAVLKTRLQTFRDKKKAEIAERVNINLNQKNQEQTAQMQKHLDKMSEILNKLEIKVNKGTQDIKDPAAAKTAITAARVTIATASAAVSIQAQKDYTIQVTSEARIKVDVKTQRDKLHTDLVAIRKTVIDAKQSVANVIKVAKSGKVIEKELKEGTAGGQQ